LHTPEETDIRTEGYVGITKNPDKRFYTHKTGQTNIKVSRSFKKYPDIISSIMVIGTEEYCRELEYTLRPTPNIGWNFAAGGGLPPDRSGIPKTERQLESSRNNKGKKRSSEFRQYMSEIKTGLVVGPCSTERKQNIAEKRKGKVWYTNPDKTESTCCYPGEEPAGWSRGQKNRKRPEPGLKRKR
jgi:hypothetical protein